MLSYEAYEKAVFDWLMAKHTADNNFTFSVRKKAYKGAQTDYFIGTSNSNYFKTTFWNIPVAYPGASGDLINVVFLLSEQGLRYQVEFNQTKSPDDKQNELALEFIQSLMGKIQEMDFRGFYNNPDEAKAEFYLFKSPKGYYESMEDLFSDLDDTLSKLIPVVDKHITQFKGKNPSFKAHRFTKSEFDELISRMEDRQERYKNEENVERDPDPVNNKPNTTPVGLNQILYGPPGTGKTYKLNTEFAPKFTSQNETKTMEDFLTEQIEKLSWWEVIVLVLLKEGELNVPSIREHVFIKVKEKLSNTANINATIWSQLQTHTFPESTKVNMTNRREPYLFDKDEESVWKISHEACKQKTPELINVLKEIEDFDEIFTIKKNYLFTTFHQSFTYEDFVEGIKPVLEGEETESDGDGIDYKIEKGIFFRAADEACKAAGFLSLKDCLGQSPQKRKEQFASAKPYAIFIDEINRGNIAAIFGELITLIEDDKRLTGEQEIIVRLPYSKQEFAVPPNLHIIGTMNTADRSVEALDSALRRRFEFEEIVPDPVLIKQEGVLENADLQIGDSVFDISEILNCINSRIEKLLDKDHLIGHSYFLKIKNVNDLRDALKRKVIPLLEEYFFGDKGKIQLILGKGFVRRQQNSVLFAESNHEDSGLFADRAVWVMTNDWYHSDREDIQFEKSLNLMLNGSEE